MQKYLADEKDFCLTYGDGLADVDIQRVIDNHLENKKIGTVLAVNPPGRFGALTLHDENVIDFSEKPVGDNSFINGGFFVFNQRIFDYLNDDTTILEQEPLQKLAAENELQAFKHHGFWQPMDTLRDKNYLEKLWSKNTAPWKTWV